MQQSANSNMSLNVCQVIWGYGVGSRDYKGGERLHRKLVSGKFVYKVRPTIFCQSESLKSLSLLGW